MDKNTLAPALFIATSGAAILLGPPKGYAASYGVQKGMQKWSPAMQWILFGTVALGIYDLTRTK